MSSEIKTENKENKILSFFKNIGAGIIQIPSEHYGFGKQTFMLAKNDLLKTYKGAIIGPLWAAMKPLFQLFVYWFAFAVGLRSPHSDEMGVPYFVFLLVGFLPWFFMSEVVSRGSKCINDNRQFVTKISFPVSVIMTYTTISKFYVHIFLFSLGYVYLLFAGITPTIYHLQIIPYAVMMFAFYLALTWSLAPMCSFSKDFSNFITTIMSGLFWLSGVFYNSYSMNEGLAKELLLFNPMTYFVNGYRKAIIYNLWFYEGPYHPFRENMIFLFEFVLVIILGIFNYNRLRKELSDVL